jgi:hypothetical protein
MRRSGDHRAQKKRKRVCEECINIWNPYFRVSQTGLVLSQVAALTDWCLIAAPDCMCLSW